MAARVHALFRQLMDQPADQREAWIDNVCADDSAIAEELRELLEIDATTSGILDGSIEAIASDLHLSTGDEFIGRVGSRIGPYRLSAILGQGGMGVVYRAERDTGDFAQTVALKVIRDEKLSGYARARFLQERGILARMQHQCIARLVDGGVDEDGEPWFAMEYIEGELLLPWCDSHRLTIAQRLELALHICSAVEYAHSHLVIHRDIKPGNIMVSAGNVVKLLDFGIAKMLEDSDTGRLNTGAQVRLLTPEYSSPEQIRGEEVTTATDVHALGLLTYELLCGLRAFGADGTTSFEVQREVIENDLPPMAARLKQASARGGKSLVELADRRQLDSAKFLRDLSGDLQNILAKATRKEPERRYANVAALAEDVRRYLANQPVSASAGAWSYSAWKFVQRHRLAVALSAIAILSIVAGVSAVLWQGARTREEAKTAIAARDFLVDVFKSASPFQTQGRVVSAVDLIDSGVQRAEIKLQNQPKLQAYLFEALGTSYLTLGHRKEAKLILRKGLDAANAVGDDSLQVQQLSLDLAELTIGEDPASKEIGELLDGVIEAQKRLPMSQRSLLIRAMLARGLNQLMTFDYLRALATMRSAISESEKHGIEKESERTFAMEGLATVLAGMRHDLEAVETYREVLKIRERLFGVHSMPIARTQSIMSLPLIRIGAGREAEELLRYAAASTRDIFGESSPDYGDVLQRLGNVLVHNDKLIEAQEVLEKSLVIAKAQGEETTGLALAYNNLSQLKSSQGQYTLAETYANQALNIHTKLDGENGVYVGLAKHTLGVSLYGQGKYIEAEKVFRDLSERQQRNGWQFVVPTLDYLGRARRMLGHPSEALPLHKQAAQIGFAQSGELSEDALLAKIEIAKDERDLGRTDEARRDIDSILPPLMRVFSADHQNNLEAQYVLAQLDVADGRCTWEALRLFDALKQMYRKNASDLTWKLDELNLLTAACHTQLRASLSSSEGIRAAHGASTLLKDQRADPYAKGRAEYFTQYTNFKGK